MMMMMMVRHLDVENNSSKRSRTSCPEASITTSMIVGICGDSVTDIHTSPPDRHPLPNGHTRSNHKRDAIYTVPFVLLSRAEINTCLVLFTILFR